jgi:hypothetical protein
LRHLSVVLCHVPAAAGRQEHRHLIIRNSALELRQRRRVEIRPVALFTRAGRGCSRHLSPRSPLRRHRQAA